MRLVYQARIVNEEQIVATVAGTVTGVETRKANVEMVVLFHNDDTLSSNDQDRITFISKYQYMCKESSNYTTDV